MQGYKFVLFFIILLPGNIFGQKNYLNEETFDAFSKYLSKEFGIACKIPVGFTNMDKYNVMWKVRKNKDKHTGNIYGSTFISSNRECIVLYSTYLKHVSKEDIEMREKMDLPIYPRSQIKAEIKTALGLYYYPMHPLNNDSSRFDFNDYVTIVSGKKAGEMFNADSIYIYEIPGADSVYFIDESLEKIRKRKYPYCTSLFVSKNDRVSIDVKLFFTKKGKKKEDKYINLLSKQVWFDEDFRSK
jgi:hypothetical protein